MSIGRAAAVVDVALAACLLAVGSYGVARHDLFAGWPCVGFGFVFTGLALIWARTMRSAAESPQPRAAGAGSGTAMVGRVIARAPSSGTATVRAPSPGTAAAQSEEPR